MAATICCQKCRNPLRIDSSLENLNVASFKILADAAPELEPKAPDGPRSAAARERHTKYDRVVKQAVGPIHKRNVSDMPPSTSKLTTDMSYIMLSESQVVPDGSPELVSPTSKKKTTYPKKSGQSGKSREVDDALSRQMERSTRLFEILSARSDIDHPICSECTEILLDGYHKRQTSVITERDAYVDFLNTAQQNVPTEEEIPKTKLDLEDARRQEQVALEELEALEAEKAKLESEIAALDAESEDLDEDENNFWKERNAFSEQLAAFQEERGSLQAQLAHDTKLLESLQRRNVYNDAFNIGHDGHFGTINGLRLGRLPDHSVDWTEINAAWGQAVQLLVVVSEKLGYKWKDYKLMPVGSTSKIVKFDKQQAGGEGKPKGTILELFSNGNLPLGLGIFHARIDDAMVAFIDCLRLVGEHVEKSSTVRHSTHSLKMPYVIHKDKIGDVSIRLGNFGQDEQWTKACKYTLTCCKFLLAHASHVDESKDGR